MKRQNLVFDVGFHKGEDTEYYLKKGFRVVAFEADPELVAAGQKRFVREIAQDKLLIIEGAIVPAGSQSTVTFYKNDKLSVWGTVDAERSRLNKRNGAPSTEITVRSVNFADALLREGTPFFVKIDIEGADKVVLKTIFAANTKPQFLSWESDKVDFENIKEEIEQAAAAGYGAFKVVQQKFIPGERVLIKEVGGAQFSFQFPHGSSGPFGDDVKGHWVSKEVALRQYAEIFKRYKRWGDESIVRSILTPRLLNKVSEIIRHPLPGWYDTHARLYSG